MIATHAPAALHLPLPCPPPSIADDLVAQGWSEQSLFLSEALALDLANECRALSAADSLAPAAVGRGGAQSVQAAVRGDRIHWLNAGQSPACDAYLRIMETLRLELNRDLFLGLDTYESHFALYVPGAGYIKHLDRFRDDDKRTVSVVIYLNPAWLAADGGALRLHPAHAATRDIAPLACCMVVFLSAEMAHEVLPATRERLSLAGWFRRR